MKFEPVFNREIINDGNRILNIYYQSHGVWKLQSKFFNPLAPGVHLKVQVCCKSSFYVCSENCI